MLSTRAAVASSPGLPHTAMSPAPTITTAPAIAISAADAPAAGGVLLSGGQATPKTGITARISSERFRTFLIGCRVLLRGDRLVMAASLPVSEREPEVGQDPAIGIVGVKNAEAGFGTEDADPEAC